MPDRSLDVWLLGALVGRLDQTAGRLAFTYDTGWLGQPDAVPLSASLPLRDKPFEDQAARPFFAGLLPEQGKRDQVAKAIGVSERNDFALLDALGGDCAGAVSFTHQGEKPIEQGTDLDYRMLDDHELATIIDKLPERPLLAGEDGIRLSLAGAQDKLPVLVVDGRIALPLHGAPSSHILKPAIRYIADSVHNEGFCLALAKAVDLNAVAAEIRDAQGRPYLLVERYDRIRGPDNRPRREHQEDFCQALGVAPEYKYQNEGGPSVSDCFALLRKATRPAALYVPQLLDALLFNTLVGNKDAHAKNYSLVYGSGGTKLAPLYDVLCTSIYRELTPKMAMQIGGHYEFSNIYPRHWERFAQSAELSTPQTRRRLLELTEALPPAARKLRDDFAARNQRRPVIDRIVASIEHYCGLTRSRFDKSKSATSA
ncbi:MAG TPA: type II toxin-antitoxin system HipA family toxin [Xanthobacteraceae bacterium]|nr:type II toxin-antitoxin system HipA family toxin [Xanthobacteraceae bacterium]